MKTALVLITSALSLFVACQRQTHTRPSPAQMQTAQDDLAQSHNWPVIGTHAAGIQLSLRTRWVDGSLEYEAILTDNEGKAAGYFLRHPDSGSIPLVSFHLIFYDEGNLPLYNLYIHDRTFSKIVVKGKMKRKQDTGSFESYGKQQCTEKMYRTLLKSSSLELSYPTELDSSTPRKQPSPAVH